MRLALENLPAALLRGVADRAHRTHLHAVNGKVQMMTLLASYGLESEQDQVRLKTSVQALSGLTAALHQLWNQGSGLSPEIALSKDWPQRLLLAALREHTPEEAEPTLPVGGGVALAAALWVEAIAGNADRLQYSWLHHEGELRLQIDASPMTEAPAGLLTALSGWIDEDETDAQSSTRVRSARLSLPTQQLRAEDLAATSAKPPEVAQDRG